MLSVRQWEWHSVQGQARDDADGSTGRVLGVAASGLDLVAGLFIRLQKEDAGLRALGQTLGHFQWGFCTS